MTQIAHKISTLIHTPTFTAQHRTQDQFFTRERKLTMPRLIALMLNQMKSSVKVEAERALQILQGNSLALPELSASAFCQARKKLSDTAFIEINHILASSFYESAWAKRWHEFRLLAIDGSSAELPITAPLVQHFGKPSSHTRHPTARVSQLYDVENHLTLDSQITPFSTGERELAYRHLSCLTEGDLTLLDRGYQAFWLFAAIRQTGAHFCARLKHDYNQAVSDFVNSSSRDIQIELNPAVSSRKHCVEKGIPMESFTVRLIKIPLPGGEIEILATTLLDKERYPYARFKALYKKRWGIEEDYKVLKSRLQMENFTGLSVEAVLQDIRARMVTKNLAALMVIEADTLARQHHSGRRRRYQVNFSYALSKLRDNVIRLLMGLLPPESTRRLLWLVSRATNAVRGGRSYPRNPKAIRRSRHKMAYKTVG